MDERKTRGRYAGREERKKGRNVCFFVRVRRRAKDTHASKTSCSSYLEHDYVLSMIHISIFSLLTNRRSKTTSICLDCPNHVILGTGIRVILSSLVYTRRGNKSRDKCCNSFVESLRGNRWRGEERGFFPSARGAEKETRRGKDFRHSRVNNAREK